MKAASTLSTVTAGPDATPFLGLSAIVLVFGASRAVFYRNTHTHRQDAREISHTHYVRIAHDGLMKPLSELAPT